MMRGLRMPMTWTANRCLALLLSMGVGEMDMAELLKGSQAVAESRGSHKLGFRHIVVSQGIPWGMPPGQSDGGIQGD